MKIKILFNTRKPLLTKDFLVNMNSTYECLSTSGCSEDIIQHIKVYKPDVFLTFFEEYDDELIQRLYTMKRENSDIADLPFAVVANSDVCDECEELNKDLFSAIIRRPVTVPTITQTLSELIEALNSEDDEEEDEEEKPAPKKSAKKKRSKPAEDDYDDADEAEEDDAPAPKAKKAKRRKPAEELTEEDEDEGSESTDSSDNSDEDDEDDEMFSAAEKKHILVVDDDRNILKMLKTALENKYEVTTMASGKMAEKYLKTRFADLILLDYHMPQENGAEVLKKIRSNPRLADIPVIFLTGVSEADKVHEVVSMNLQGYLLKPINMDRLFIMIRSLIG